VTKPELGVKRDCPNCGARFYDLNKEPAHCPKCDHDFIPEALLKPRRQRVEETSEEAAKPVAETSLEAAEKERKAAESKRKPALDDEETEAEEEEDLADIADIDIDIDDEDDDSLLEDDDEDDDMSSIVANKDGEED
jgi:uncharacterized protein (TIGR02300 family)